MPRLLSGSNKSVAFFAARDLEGDGKADTRPLWELPDALRIVKRQQPDGSWTYPGGNAKVRSRENYNQIETFRNLGYLVEMFGFNNAHPAITSAADFLFGFQTKQGEIKGILGNQYSPYYTAAMVELFVDAGLTQDKRVEKAFKWLGSMRQDDGGWAIPLRTRDKKLDFIESDAAPLEPDRRRPFSHLVTGIVLRAYAAHPTYRRSPEAQGAAKLLLSRFFKSDKYPDRSSADFWLRFTYPFWFTDLLSATDSLSKLGFTKAEPQIEKAVQWFVERQQEDGLWRLKTLKNEKRFETELWISLAICRVIKRLNS